MNPETPISRPEIPSADTLQIPSESGCGFLPQTFHGASRSVSSSPATQPPVNSSNPKIFNDPGVVYPQEMPAEPDFDFATDNEDARTHQLLLDDLASDNDDFARSAEDGWYYSDEESGMDAVPDSPDWED